MTCVKCGADLQPQALYCSFCGKKQATQNKSRRTRANGQGSVYRLPNGKWRAAKTIGYEQIPGTNPPKTRRICVTRSDFAKKIDALNYLPILGTEADTRDTMHGDKVKAVVEDKTGITLKALYDLWLPTHRATKSTINCYKAGFLVFQDVWDIPMNEQDVDELQECIDGCDKGVRTRQNARTALGLIYKYGMPRGYVPNNAAGKPNLAEFLKVGESEQSHKEGLTEAELNTVKQSIGIVPYADYIYCHCYLGFRPSALIALKVSDYNPAERAFVGGIKTDAGKNRTVTVSPKIQPIIDRLVADSKSGFVFEQLDGTPMSVEKYRENFYKALDAMGIQPSDQLPHRLTPHCCRHTFATLMKNVPAPEKDKLELIGHTSERQLREYQDVRYDDLRRITDAM